MKKVFSSHSMVAHMWAQQSQSEGRGPRMFFDGPTIYSHGRHFPIASFVRNDKGEQCVLFNDASYSASTSQHQRHTQQAIPRLIPVFKVRVVISENSDFAIEANMKDYKERIDALYLQALRARSRAAQIQRECQDLALSANHYAIFFGSSIRIPFIEFTPEAIAKAKQDWAEQKAKTAADNKRRIEREAAQALQIIEDWRAGMNTRVIYGAPVMLRRRGELMETSHGAEVSMQDARRAFQFIKLVRDSGNAWTRNGQTVRVGPFQIDSIDAFGNIVAGCHSIDWEEIRRFAREQNFFDDVPSDAIVTTTREVA